MPVEYDATASVDRIVCVNALHHFSDPASFLAEARQILRPDGGVLSIGLDPHEGRDRWWIYDSFPDALEADCARYLATAELRRLTTAAGFVDCPTAEAQHMPAELPVRVAIERGMLERNATSQLMVISDDAYQSGIERIRSMPPAPGDHEPMLRADLRLYATTEWLRTHD